jgi:broad specificity phosphatase PhoE
MARTIKFTDEELQLVVDILGAEAENDAYDEEENRAAFDKLDALREKLAAAQAVPALDAWQRKRDLSLRPRPGESAEDVVKRVTRAAKS